MKLFLVDMTVDFYVYQHRRLTDGKVFYVGKGHKGRAWSKDRRNPHWLNVVAKHGYTVEILEDGLQAWYAYEREVEVIAQRVEAGCRLTNRTSGGDGVIGYEWTDAHRAKIGASSKALWKTESYRKKVIERAAAWQRKAWSNPEYRESAIAKMKSGIDPAKKSQMASENNAKNWADPAIRAKRIIGIRAAKADPTYRQKEDARLRAMWGSPERKQALRESKRGAMQPVLCVEAGITFDAINAATRWLVEHGFASAAKSNIRAVCQGKMKTAYGYKWQFAEESI